MLMTWSSRERNRSCSPLSRRSRGRIEPSANHVRGQRITAGDSRESPTSICKKIDPGAPISGKSNRWNSCNFYCPSIASGYFTDDWNSAADLPDVSKCFRGIAQSIHASDHHATLHGVVFDILVGSTSRVGLAAVFPVDDRRMACRAVAREPRARLRPLGFGAAAFVASRAKAGGPGRTRTCNQTVMSGRILIDFVDLAAFSFGYDRVRCDLMRSFLVRNGCGSYGRVSPQIAFALDPEVANFAAADFD